MCGLAIRVPDKGKAAARRRRSCKKGRLIARRHDLTTGCRAVMRKAPGLPRWCDVGWREQIEGVAERTRVWRRSDPRLTRLLSGLIGPELVWGPAAGVPCGRRFSGRLVLCISRRFRR